ncbi:MAG TPA: lactate utilization protein [Bryobacteraceae bacterium]|nr:lactate utilization protein [Bryobacteraceae bacterium]
MTAREQILGDVRTALGRAGSRTPPALAAPLLRISQTDRNLRTRLFVQNLEKLSGKVILAPNAASATQAIQNILAGQPAVASNAPFLATCGVTSLPNVRSGFTDREALREASSTAVIGITSADYALAETGSLVLLSSPLEARLISLLPPVHVAVFPRSRILANLDELLRAVPLPAEQTSSMVLITGPSRTADIEQILVRGVHGPGEVYAVIVEDS